MAQVIHMFCRHCGERLSKDQETYCSSCNLYLCYRAMPILLGMVLTGRLATDLAGLYPDPALVRPRGYDDPEALVWE
jgi:hypothetical protein